MRLNDFTSNSFTGKVFPFKHPVCKLLILFLQAQIWEPLPLVSFATMSILAGLLTLLFPETLHKKLPDTVQEAENIGKIDSKPADSSEAVNCREDTLEKY